MDDSMKEILERLNRLFPRDDVKNKPKFMSAGLRIVPRNKRNKMVEKTVTELTSKVREIEKENADLKTEADHLEFEIARLKTAINHLDFELARLKAEVSNAD